MENSNSLWKQIIFLWTHIRSESIWYRTNRICKLFRTIARRASVNFERVVSTKDIYFSSIWAAFFILIFHLFLFSFFFLHIFFLFHLTLSITSQWKRHSTKIEKSTREKQCSTEKKLEPKKEMNIEPKLKSNRMKLNRIECILRSESTTSFSDQSIIKNQCEMFRLKSEHKTSKL